MKKSKTLSKKQLWKKLKSSIEPKEFQPPPGAIWMGNHGRILIYTGRKWILPNEKRR